MATIISKIDAATAPFVGQGDLIIFSAISDYSAATLASSSSASKRRFLQPGREVLCQESSGRDWLGPCSPGSPAGARAQLFV